MNVVLRTVVMYFFLIVSVRIMGKRQLGELELSELVITLMVSELAVVPISDDNISLLRGMIPIAILLAIEVAISKIMARNGRIKRLFCGTPSVLIRSGEIDEAELRRSRIGIDELMSELRQNGIAHIEDVSYAIIESNGKMSVIPRAKSSPASAKDAGISVTESGISHGVIVNGTISDRSLFQAGKTEAWLDAVVKDRRIDVSDVLLMTVDDSGEIRIYMKEK